MRAVTLGPNKRLGRLAIFGGLAALTVLGLAFTLATANARLFPVDARVYHHAWQQTNLYVPGAALGQATYIYSPAFAELIRPLTLVPWATFAVLWTALATIAYAWLLWPLELPIRLAALAYVAVAVLPVGNIEWLLALVAIAALRYPAAWALPLLTKVTPGIGVLWYAARAEWRAFATAVGATVVVVLVSAAVAPSLWVGWIGVLGAPHQATVLRLFPEPGPLVRTVLAVPLVVWGARTERPWAIPAAMVLAQPDLGLSTLGVLCALPRLQRGPMDRVRP